MKKKGVSVAVVDIVFFLSGGIVKESEYTVNINLCVWTLIYNSVFYHGKFNLRVTLSFHATPPSILSKIDI